MGRWGTLNITKSSLKTSLKNLLKHQTDKTSIQFFRYIFVGGIAFLIDIGFLYILTNFFGYYYLISAAISFTLGLIANYLLSTHWVFNKHNLNNLTLEFSIFTIIGIIGLGLNELFIWFFTAELNIYYLTSKIFAAILILLWNFLARKYTLYN
ncbi:MAG: GtrA family protein [Methanobacterium sp.]